MISYEAYLDESYESSELFAVAGYLFRCEQAHEAEVAWKQALDEFGLPYFHMVDCAHGVGLFKGMTQRRRSEIAARMIALTAKSEFGFVALVNPSRFSKVNTNADPYIFCVDILVMSLCAWLSDKGPSQIAFFLESGHASASKSASKIDRLKSDPDVAKCYLSYTFAQKEDVRLLQAADLLAWQSTKFIKDKISKKRKPRGDFLELLKHPHAFHYVVFHNNQVGISIDESPHIPFSPRDDYVRAMFALDLEGDRQIERTHAQMIFRQKALGDVVFPNNDDEL
jgi:hypothetical protein